MGFQLAQDPCEVVQSAKTSLALIPLPFLWAPTKLDCCPVLLCLLWRRDSGCSGYPNVLLLFASYFLNFQAGFVPELTVGILTVGCPSVCMNLRRQGWVV